MKRPKNTLQLWVCLLSVGIATAAQAQPPSVEVVSVGLTADLTKVIESDEGSWVVGNFVTKPGNATLSIKSVVIDGATGEFIQRKGEKDIIRYVGELTVASPILSNRNTYRTDPIPYEVTMPHEFEIGRLSAWGMDERSNAKSLLRSGGEGIVEYNPVHSSEMPFGKAYLLPLGWGRHVPDALTAVSQTKALREKGEAVDYSFLLKQNNPIIVLFALKEMKRHKALAAQETERVAALFSSSTRHVGLAALISLQARDNGAAMNAEETTALVRRLVLTATTQDLLSMLDGLQLAKVRDDVAPFDGELLTGFGAQLLRAIRLKAENLNATSESRALKRRLQEFFSPSPQSTQG